MFYVGKQVVSTRRRMSKAWWNYEGWFGVWVRRWRLLNWNEFILSVHRAELHSVALIEVNHVVGIDLPAMLPISSQKIWHRRHSRSRPNSIYLDGISKCVVSRYLCVIVLPVALHFSRSRDGPSTATLYYNISYILLFFCLLLTTWFSKFNFAQRFS